MEVLIFDHARTYQKWLNIIDFSIEIVSIVVFKGELVITYKRK